MSRTTYVTRYPDSINKFSGVNIRLNRISTAEEYLDESGQLNQEAEDRIGRAWNYKHRGQILKKIGEIGAVIELIRKGKQILNHIGNIEYIADFNASLEQEAQLFLGLNGMYYTKRTYNKRYPLKKEWILVLWFAIFLSRSLGLVGTWRG